MNRPTRLCSGPMTRRGFLKLGTHGRHRRMADANHLCDRQIGPFRKSLKQLGGDIALLLAGHMPAAGVHRHDVIEGVGVGVDNLEELVVRRASLENLDDVRCAHAVFAAATNNRLETASHVESGGCKRL